MRNCDYKNRRPFGYVQDSITKWMQDTEITDFTITELMVYTEFPRNSIVNVLEKLVKTGQLTKYIEHNSNVYHINV